MMCKQCERLKIELENEKECKIANYNAYQELSEKFKKLAVAYCYETDMCNPLD